MLKTAVYFYLLRGQYYFSDITSSASEMTYIVSGGALNSTHSLIQSSVFS